MSPLGPASSIGRPIRSNLELIKYGELWLTIVLLESIQSCGEC
jgi:hypothetical protein